MARFEIRSLSGDESPYGQAWGHGGMSGRASVQPDPQGTIEEPLKIPSRPVGSVSDFEKLMTSHRFQSPDKGFSETP